MRHLLAVVERGGRLSAVVHDAGAVTSFPLHGEFDWTVSRERTCIGSWWDETYVPCPTGARLGPDESQCLPCSGMVHPDCAFEPLCQNGATLCECPFGPLPHVVYAAFFGTLPKIGMTQERRVGARVREQGADAWFVVGTAPSRAEARLLEKQVSTLYRIPEYRTHREVLPQLARPVPWDKIEARAQELRLRLEARYDVERGLHRVAAGLAQPLPSVPHRVMAEGHHAGLWLGAKGNHLFYAAAARRGHVAVGAVHAVQRSALMGRYI